MKKAAFLLLVLTGYAWFAAAQGNAFWTKAPGPYGAFGATSFTLTSDGTLYTAMDWGYSHTAGVPTTLFRSNDQGQHWEKITPMLNGQPIRSFINVGPGGNFNVMIPNDSTNDYSPGSLYRSSDGGSSWTLIATNLIFYRVYEAPDGSLIGRTFNANKIYRSTDGGTTWTTVFNAPYTILNYEDMHVLQNGGITIRGGFNGTYYSSDNGQSWQAIDDPGNAGGELFVSSSGAMFYMNGGVYRSANNGQSWQMISGVPSANSSPVELANGTLLLVTSDNDLYRSTNDGLNWQQITSSHPLNYLLPVRLADGSLFAHINDAFYRSTDNGANWQFASSGIDLAHVWQMEFLSEDTIFAWTRNGLFRTYDRGAQWTKLTDENEPYLHSYFPLKRTFDVTPEGHLLTTKGKSLLWSDDLGDSWTNIAPPNGVTIWATAISPDGILFCNSKTAQSGASQRMYRSANEGQSWTVPAGETISNFNQIAFHPSGRYFATGYNIALNDEGPWYSDDQGQSWLPVPGLPSTPDNLSAGMLLIDPAGVIYIVMYEGASTYRLYRSDDIGLHWVAYPNTLPADMRSIYFNAAGHMILNEQFRSIDEGLSWQPLPAFGQNWYLLDQPLSPGQYLYTNFAFLGLYRTVNPTTEGAYLRGYVRKDADDDCSTPDAQNPMPNWTVEARGASTFVATTDPQGHYQMFVDTGAYQLEAQLPNPWWWAACEGIVDVQASVLSAEYDNDFSMISTSGCPLMTVDLAIPALRRCFNNNMYVSYCNQGSEPADSAWVEVSLDPFAELVSASVPYADQGQNVFRFLLGNVGSTECGQFSLVVYLDCDSTVLGQTHCFSAHAFPDTLCRSIPDWSGATIQASASCQDSVVHLSLKNITDIPSAALDYIIIVDDVVLMTGNQSYGPGQEIDIDQPADGHTWRIESEQEPGHPFATPANLALAFVEGCGGFNSLGYVNQFPVDNFSPSNDRECVENTASYDPNDKQGFPIGSSAEHYIRRGQEIEYLVRFQNTGNDTAFTVIILDTLSAWFDASSVQVGAASHPYTWSLSGEGALQFTFANIMLPDSNVNEPASHGFVSFRIRQQPELALGTQILNKALIYFDFNEPVVTNQTLHTVGESPFVVGQKTPVLPGPGQQVLASPNPARDQVVLQALQMPFRNARVVLTDGRGVALRQFRANGPSALIERGNLPQGIYFYRIESAEGKPEGSGQVFFID